MGKRFCIFAATVLALLICIVGFSPTPAFAADGGSVYVGGIELDGPGYVTTDESGTVTKYEGAGAPADSHAYYDIWVEGIQVTSANASDVLGDADEGATVSYDAQTNTLTLDHADLANTSESRQYPLQTAEPGLTIKLVGENTVSSSVENYPAVHIAPEQGETKIVGDGVGAKLTVTSDVSEGIRVDWSNLAVQDCTVFIRTDVWGGLIVSGGVLAIRGAQVNVASSPDPGVAKAVYVLRGENGISITNSTVTASNGRPRANVIYSGAGIFIDGSTVTATGTAADAYPAIFAAGDIDVKNSSEVTAKSAGMRGIFTEADMTISNKSKVTASGTTNEGMVVVGKLKVEGSKLHASTSSDNEMVPALVTEQLEVIASDVTLEGGLGLREFYGGSADNASFVIEPAAGKLAEFKVDPVNRDGSAADHFNERDATHVSPYDKATELNETEMNWLGAYRYVHIGEHVHTGGTATCVVPAVCDDCGREYGAADPDAHSFTAYTSNNDATCTEDGTEKAACDNGCGATDTRVVQGSALGHDHELVDAKPATCEDDGYTGDEVCKRCHELLKQGAAIPALGHDFENGVCTVCGERDPDYVAPGRPVGPGDPDEPEEPSIPDASEVYPDVPADAWYLEPVSWASHEGVMTGYADGTFGPEAVLTRSQMATVLWRLAGGPGADTSVLAGWPDLDAGAFYAEAVAWALGEGVINGYADGTFGPEDALTREQAACVLMGDAARRGEDVSARADLSAYGDAGDVSAFASEAVSWAVAEGVISGKEPEPGVTLLDPQGACTRAELCALLMRLVAE